jgi:hypothetical protein
VLLLGKSQERITLESAVLCRSLLRLLSPWKQKRMLDSQWALQCARDEILGPELRMYEILRRVLLTAPTFETDRHMPREADG